MATGMASIVGGYLIVTEASGLLSGYQKNGYLAAILTLFSLYLAKNIKIRKT